MKWNEQLAAKLRELCYEGKSNKEIAEALNCRIEDVYAKRSQLGITIDKCKKPADASQELEETLPVRKAMDKNVMRAFVDLQDALLLAIASDWTSLEDAKIYRGLSEVMIELQSVYFKLLKG